jgi:hypothetical protein
MICRDAHIYIYIYVYCYLNTHRMTTLLNDYGTIIETKHCVLADLSQTSCIAFVGCIVTLGLRVTRFRNPLFSLLIWRLCFGRKNWAGWWFQAFFIFHNLYGIILPIDELIFFKVVIAPPTSEFYGRDRVLELPLLSDQLPPRMEVTTFSASAERWRNSHWNSRGLPRCFFPTRSP